MEFYQVFILFFSIALVGNIFINFKYKKNRNLILNHVKDMDFVLEEKVKMVVSSRSSFNISKSWSKTDILFLDRQIILLQKNHWFHQPCFQFVFDPEIKKIKGVSKVFEVQEFEQSDNELIFKNKINKPISGKMKFKLSLRKTNFKELEAKYNYSVFPDWELY